MKTYCTIYVSLSRMKHVDIMMT